MGMEKCIEKIYPKKEYLAAIYTVFLKEKEEQALRYLAAFKGKKIIATVSGKDSIVAGHLSIRALGPLDIVINRYVGRRKMPDAIIDELADIAKKIGAKSVLILEKQWGPHDTLFRIVAEEFDIDAIIAGLRRQEDGHWANRLFKNKEIAIVAPIQQWRHSDVWSYLYVHSIPLPSPYCNDVTPPWASLQSLVT
jgi:3'-phosphoadenosine 5'-phosphosulfate sulfotransferase (PAPS reductase)/FAD synthetase